MGYDMINVLGRIFPSFFCFPAQGRSCGPGSKNWIYRTLDKCSVGAIMDRPQILPKQNLSPQGENFVISSREIRKTTFFGGRSLIAPTCLTTKGLFCTPRNDPRLLSGVISFPWVQSLGNLAFCWIDRAFLVWLESLP